MNGWIGDIAIGFLIATTLLFVVCGISWCWLRWKIESEAAAREQTEDRNG